MIAIKRGAGAKRGNAPKVLIEGHMDEIGLMVTEIEKGFLRFTQVGGFDARVLLAQEVIVHGKKDLRGIVGARPPHVLTAEERNQVISLNKLFIDVGLPQEKLRELVQPGDLITLARQMVTLKNNRVAGKAFDDRSAIVCIAEALRHLAGMKHAWDVYAVANVQEEAGAGFAGAFTSTYHINPTVGIALDVNHADQPGTTEVNAVPLDDGMGIAMGPNIHPLVHKKLVEVADAQEILYRVTAYAGMTGTDAWAMQIVREGIPTGLIDIPLRYMHTSVEMLSINDVERIGRLLAQFCAGLDEKFVAELEGKEKSQNPKTKAQSPKAKTQKARKKGKGN
ncbi:MAG: M42 family peptidase [Chloroflexi bacterium]|nr:M42 family peptidase [Chloroflexota bacterium]